MTPAPRRPSFESPAAPVRVLVVDDDPRVLAGLDGVLGATPGLAVAAVTGSPSRALALASGGRADVALVDALLPTLADGVRLVRQLSTHIPVVGISLDGTSQAHVLAAGAVAYLEKDGDVEDLVRTVHAAAGAALSGEACACARGTTEPGNAVLEAPRTPETAVSGSVPHAPGGGGSLSPAVSRDQDVVVPGESH
jgi:DNA-binding NarL/FixJ family response regulator